MKNTTFARSACTVYTITYQDGETINYYDPTCNKEWYEMNLRTDSTVMKVMKDTSTKYLIRIEEIVLD